ncbi:MAG: hypothetical protein LC799_00615, partial [Actinobacteria bacterium]|nr:hypothetical protein [Actinomycetota bacterium]
MTAMLRRLYEQVCPEARTKREMLLIKQSLAQPAHLKTEPTTRVDRGRDLYAEHADEITYKDGSWFVPSTTVEGRFYA